MSALVCGIHTSLPRSSQMKSNDDALQPVIFFVTMVVSFGVRNTGSATVVHATVGHGSYATRMETTTTSQTTYLTIIAYVNRTRGSMRLVTVTEGYSASSGVLTIRGRVKNAERLLSLFNLTQVQ